MRSIITIILLATGTICFAQRYVDTYDPKDEEVKSLLGRGNELNGFGGADLKITDLVGEKGLIAGGYGGALVNRRYMIGVAGYGITTELDMFSMPEVSKAQLPERNHHRHERNDHLGQLCHHHRPKRNLHLCQP